MLQMIDKTNRVLGSKKKKKKRNKYNITCAKNNSEQRYLLSISSTFFARVFDTNVVLAAFFLVTFGLAPKFGTKKRVKKRG
jgi:hypothetical protein